MAKVTSRRCNHCGLFYDLPLDTTSIQTYSTADPSPPASFVVQATPKGAKYGRIVHRCSRGKAEAI